MTAAAANQSYRDKSGFVGRGGLKLAHALNVFGPDFGLNVTGLRCADFGCNVGGFTDCLLQHGAARVYAIDTGYGVLDYRLRVHRQVVVRERTNALHAEPPPPEDGGPVDLVTIDMGWTRQEKCIPAALSWLGRRREGWIITLIKPHYEAETVGRKAALRDGVLAASAAEEVMQQVLKQLPALGVQVLGVTKSPIMGGATRGNRRGNIEYLALARPCGKTMT